jgi:hypothetical protein
MKKNSIYGKSSAFKLGMSAVGAVLILIAHALHSLFLPVVGARGLLVISSTGC